ncbi:hypothetical protein [Algoriphagus sediminis]|uniref:N-acetyltransferase domain-containing protein n=1 Tax=Algoriphagus sediminis TaxID=3057113 RepID=A0ABT7YEG8_9BACT|nr:hypothetical protein [Algoriphagus sediminis]MDN3204735.1 hypothetical protein [Algoriphagus sediminis]
MSLLSKIRPYQVDLLVFKVPESLNPESAILPFPVTEKAKDVFVFEDKGKQAHKSKIFRGSRILKSFGYKTPILCIGDCETPEEYRGKSLYPKMLRYLYTKFQNEAEIFILVAPNNMASIRGIEKSGAKKDARIKCLKIGPIYLNKEIERFD